VPTLHKLFNDGLISFADNGLMLISTKLRASERAHLGLDEPMKLQERLNPQQKKHLAAHRNKHRFG
jgi:hypothetical protein